MSNVFDSSSIYALVRAHRAELLIGGYTCSLARYEIGNILLKERSILKRISEGEQMYLLEACTRALGLMEPLGISGREAAVMRAAEAYGMSFYDASYVHIARERRAVLVTQDGKLAKKVKGHVRTATAEELPTI